MAAETQYSANTAMVTISSAESALDGTNAVTVITGASSGTLIKTVTVKAQGNITEGMIRLFVYDGVQTKIIQEINIPRITKSSRYPTFETTINLDFILEASSILKATTQNAESFNIIAEGLDWTYYGSVRPESTKYTANTGMVTVSTANSNLDGSGALGTVLTAASSGTIIQSIVIKAQVNTTPGMVRLFLYDGSNYTKLFKEIPIPYVTKSGTAHSFSHRIDFGERDFALKANWVLKASTENAEAFNVIAEGLDWTYPA